MLPNVKVLLNLFFKFKIIMLITQVQSQKYPLYQYRPLDHAFHAVINIKQLFAPPNSVYSSFKVMNKHALSILQVKKESYSFPNLRCETDEMKVT